jgi:flagellar motor switch protein FliN
MAEQDAQDGWSDDGLPPEGVGAGQAPEALAMMMDIPLEVTVELGRASLTLAEVLALGPGSVVELDRLPGEPLELFANGRLIARGEVVVLNDTFGLRVTEIVQNARGRGA